MANEDAKVFTPVGYLPGINPGGLHVHVAAGEAWAYVVDRGWPAEADSADPGNLPPLGSEDPDTRGGSVCKVELGSKKMLDDSDWPALAVYLHGQAGGSEKPYLGPFVGTFSGGTFSYVLGNAFREVAPGVRAASDNRDGLVYGLEANGAGLALQGPPVSSSLFGPAGLALHISANDNYAYVTNSRAATGQAQLLRFDVDPSTGALSNGTAITLNAASGVADLIAPGAVLLRQESGTPVLYIADEADTLSNRGHAVPLEEDRARILRVVLSGTNGTMTLFAEGLDRPIALAEHADADLNNGFELFVACAWPRHRSEVGYRAPGSPNPPCLPPWYTWRYPFGTIRRVQPASSLTDKADVKTFTPALVEPGGIAVVGDNLYVVTLAGAPEAPNEVHDLLPDPCTDPTPPLWPWRPPPSAMIYRVSLV